MKKYFKVKEGGCYHLECVDFEANAKAVDDVYVEFCKAVGMEYTGYLPTNGKLYIEPTGENLELFGKQLGKVERGAAAFRTNSKPGKLWVSMLKEKELEVVCKPEVSFWIRGHRDGVVRTTLFSIDGIYYGTCDRDYDFGELPEDLEEMKASDYHTMIEDVTLRKAYI